MNRISADFKKTQGDIDFVFTSAGSSGIFLCENKGDNLSYNTKRLGTDYIGAWPLSIGDMNNDNYLDIVGGAQGTGKITWFKNDEIVIDNVDEFIDPNYLNVFPNPVKDKINIEFHINKSSKLNIALYNLLGQKCKTLENQTFHSGDFKKQYEIDDSFVGMYLLKITCNNQVLTRKIFID